MNLKQWVNSSADTRRKYGYYRSLGYSKHASRVLSAVTYGDLDLTTAVSRMKGESVIGDLYRLLKESKAADPEKAIEVFVYGERPDEGPEDPMSEHYAGWDLFAGGTGSGSRTPNVAPSYGSAVGASQSKVMYSRSVAPSATSTFMHIDRDEEVYAAVELPWPSVPLDSDAYEDIEEKNARGVFESPSSTFRMTTSNASMGIVMNQIRNERRVDLSQVRIEEMLNYFDYDAKIPENAKFSISTELLPKKGNKKILYINAQAAQEKKDRQNVILLLDVSGSMTGNAETTQQIAATVFSKLKPGDRISLVTYSSQDHTYLEGYEIRGEADKEYLMGIILGIEITGGTWGSAGIETAYRIGAEHYLPDGNNQVILITDGDLNFGITEKGGLQQLIEEKKKTGLFLSVIGTGLYNYRDDKLETLSKHGNGTYCVVNDLDDVDECVNRRYISLTNVIAKDVKAQVEFNPRFVKSYRLLGYENRELSHGDFSNDEVVSEPYGSGGHGIALYELEMADGKETEPADEYKYQKPVLKDSSELGTVRIRYKEPLSDSSELIEKVISGSEGCTQNAQLAYLLYCVSEKLRGSDKLDEYDGTYLEVMTAGGLYRNFPDPNGKKLEELIGQMKRS